MPKVSVIMGIYNEKNKKQTALAIDSILNQTYKDFEFMICDDGSDEACYQWLTEYCRKDGRIHIIRNETNAGLSIALNHCLEHVSSEYVARMDADDLSKPVRIEKQVAFLESHKEYSLVGSNAELIDHNGIWGERKLTEKPEKEDFLYTSPFIHPSIVMRTEALRQLNGYSTEKYALRVEDYDLFMRAYTQGMKGYNIQENLIQYREDRASYQKRKYRYRINECKVRARGFKQLGIRRGNIRYVIKPLIVGLVPARLAMRVKKKKLNYNERERI